MLLTRRGRGVAVVQSVNDYQVAEEERAFMRAVVTGLASRGRPGAIARRGQGSARSAVAAWPRSPSGSPNPHFRPPFRTVYRRDSKRVRVVRVWRSECLLPLPSEDATWRAGLFGTHLFDLGKKKAPPRALSLQLSNA